MEWNGKKIMQQVHVFRNLSTPIILAINNLGIEYLCRAQSFIFQDRVSHQNQLQTVDLRIISQITIPAHMGILVKFGTSTVGRRSSNS
jgi:hypothetical protein